MGFAPALALFMLAVMALGAVAFQQMQAADLRQVVKVEMPDSLRLQQVSERINVIHGELYLIMTNQAAEIDVDTLSDRMTKLLAEMDAVSKELEAVRAAASPSDKAALAELLKQWADCKSAIETVEAMRSADFATAAGFLAPFEETYASMTATLDKVVEKAQAGVNARADQSFAQAETSRILMIVGALATLGVVGVVAAASVLTTRGAVRRIADATERTAKGDTAVDLEALKRGDELGAIVRSLAVFQDNQRRLEDMRREQDAAREAAAAEQQLVATELGEGLDRLVAGDLTHRIHADFPGRYGKLRDDFNAAMAQLEDTLGVILAASADITAGTSEISRASGDLAVRTEQQTATLRETVQAVDEITGGVRKTADGAAHARETVSAARHDAERSGVVVREAVAAMSQIERSAREISRIVGVIDAIATQTNLLALNASIEAARAGDAGRSFAVVASEVRTLAQRSAEAAKEISGLIATSTQSVDQGVTLVGQTGEALERIVGQVVEINDTVAEIAAFAQDQASGLNQVNAAVGEMDTVTRQNAAMVDGTAASSHALASQAEELARLIGRFRVGAVQGEGSFARAA